MIIVQFLPKCAWLKIFVLAKESPTVVACKLNIYCLSVKQIKQPILCKWVSCRFLCAIVFWPFTSVVPKVGINYPLGVICDSSVCNAEPKPQCCSAMSNHCEILRVIRHNRHLDLGNGLNKFGNQWFTWQKTRYFCVSSDASSLQAAIETRPNIGCIVCFAALSIYSCL